MSNLVFDEETHNDITAAQCLNPSSKLVDIVELKSTKRPKINGGMNWDHAMTYLFVFIQSNSSR